MLLRFFALLWFVSPAAPLAFAQEVQIGVLGLFHPRQITLHSVLEDGIVITASDETFMIESGSHSGIATIRISGQELVVDFRGKSVHASEIRAAGRNHDAVTFILSIPGKMTRRYHGRLVVKAIDGVVAPIVTMDLETAVASVVDAESLHGTKMEALKAQAVVARSYFAAGAGRHHDFDFCDLTHCQFLREPPPQDSDASTASASTRGLILSFEGKPIATMFTRSCGGKTRTPAELNMQEGSYPYFSVVCDYCRKNPVRWSRRMTHQDAAQLIGKGEGGRLAINRRLGWNTVPSNNFAAHEEDGEVLLEGVGQGHGIGLCQRGARGMAEEGIPFREILSHYFPNTTLAVLNSP